MRRWLAITITLVLAVSVAVPAATADDDTPPAEIPWSPDRKLKWEDFSGPVPADPEHAAFTRTNRTALAWACKGGVVVITSGGVAVMVPGESGVKDEESKTATLLEHEQKHFDLAEAYARKLRADLAKIKCKGKTNAELATEVSAADQANFDEWTKAEEQYDEDTKHGTDAKQQEKWCKKIEKLLEKYGKKADKAEDKAEKKEEKKPGDGDGDGGTGSD